MKRVKLFDLSETVQAVCIKNTSNDDKPSIDFQIYTSVHKAWITFSWPAKYKNDETRDLAFDTLEAAGIIKIFNEVVEQNGLPLDLIPENTDSIEVNNPEIVK